jgi:eukaryotic-like serine/threonine-protein kinase
MEGELRPTDPRRLGSYELLRRLGRGGMGEVFLGRGPDGRLVAVKVIRPEYVDDAEFRARFRSEVTRVRQVPPFCTAAVLDADPDHDPPYLVVEYVDGPSLDEIVTEQGPLEAGSLHSVAVGVATALAAIHGAGVVHRDLKPGNVLFALGSPKVIDFGIARRMEDPTRHTRTDRMVGTVSYMAPERFATDVPTVSPASDVFAWGVVVAYAGTGHTPFDADSPAATAAKILTQPPRLTGLDQPLHDLVARALAKNPADRPSAHELLDLLLSADTAELARRPELRRAAEAARATRPRRRRLSIVLAAVAVAATLTLVVALPLLHRAGGGETPPGSGSSPVRGPAVIDRLDRPGQWAAVRGRCVFVGALVISPDADGSYRCPGPAEIFAGDQSIAVDVSLGGAGACAQIWFRVVAQSGYLLSACPARLALQRDSGGTSTLATAPAALYPPPDRHRIVIDIRADRAAVTVDGRAALGAAVNDPALAAGQVTFGASATGAGGFGQATFANAEIRS